MQKALLPSSMVPPGFAVVSASTSANSTTIVVRSALRENYCARCGTLISRVHSRYGRRIADIPWLVGWLSSWPLSAAFAAQPLDVVKAFLPNASPTVS